MKNGETLPKPTRDATRCDFTPELIRRCQDVYSRKSGSDITPGDAEIILNQLAEYGDVVARANGWSDDNKT